MKKKLLLMTGLMAFVCHAEPYILTAETQESPEQVSVEQPALDVPKPFAMPRRDVLTKKLQDANTAFDNFVQSNDDVRDLWQQIQPVEEQVKTLRAQMKDLGDVGEKFNKLKMNVGRLQMMLDNFDKPRPARGGEGRKRPGRPEFEGGEYRHAYGMREASPAVDEVHELNM